MSIYYDIVIPAYNAQHTLPDIIEQIQQLPHPPDTIFVIDDGSQDGTAEVVKKFKNVVLFSMPDNGGKGRALKKGFELFKNKNSTQYLLLMDADGQHPVECIPQFLSSVKQTPADLVIGNRRRKFGQMPVLRILSNTLSSLITSWVTGTKINDSQCGFRLLHRQIVENLDFEENGFQIETELIIKAVKHGYRIEFVPIPTVYNGQKSYIKHFNDTVRFLRIIIKEIWSR